MGSSTGAAKEQACSPFVLVKGETCGLDVDSVESIKGDKEEEDLGDELPFNAGRRDAS